MPVKQDIVATKAEITQTKRRLVLFLVIAQRYLERGDITAVKAIVPLAQYDAVGLTRASVDWRKHKVRAKTYKGLLGVFYDKFEPYQCSAFYKV